MILDICGDPTFMGPKKFDKYTLIRLIGRGGAGEVWHAKDEEGKDCALKILSIDITKNTKGRGTRGDRKKS